MPFHKGILAAAVTGIACGAFSTGAQAQQSVEQFYAGKKTITMSVGYAPGGSYDLYARLVARNLGRFIPGQPAVVPQNMPGAGSLQAANYIYAVAPKDGTAIAALGETLAMEQALQNPGAKYDAAKLTWIGRIASSNNIHLVWNTSKAKSVEDAKTIETTMAGTGPANLAETVPRLLNALIGTKFKVVSGYPSSGPAMLAMERGEVDGTGTSWAVIKAQHQDWLRDKKITIILQDLPERDPELADVPALLEFAKTDADKQLLTLYASGGAIGRAYTAPPNLPPAIAAALREGFQKMAKDPELLAEAAKMNLSIEPADHLLLQKVVEHTVKADENVRKRVREIFAN
ncbi:tripartite tricarboxylate transporter substrate-binding protein [Roseiarcaceae bacterium H3SJ34-1]|uniref:Bug family tripartite tricarboxylate transporter substrate binding protein n=1 Tax=Terripilifer ovatus TaxID=3032367 RepID=UPI003AB92A45|nr:tripartite tricarboxylate transporter substrate-binding protein [Roseiarcaceae bacterium H3SJ34-1]